eukprot:COSAG05_NODE_709_length_7823_cov_2.423485_2_plen_238_part_00
MPIHQPLTPVVVLRSRVRQHSVDPLTNIRAATAAMGGRATLHVAPDTKAIRLQRHEAEPKVERVRLARTRSGPAIDDAARHELLPDLPREAVDPPSISGSAFLGKEPARTRPLMWVRDGHKGGAAGLVPHSIDMSDHHKGTHVGARKNQHQHQSAIEDTLSRFARTQPPQGSRSSLPGSSEHRSSSSGKAKAGRRKPHSTQRAVDVMLNSSVVEDDVPVGESALCAPSSGKGGWVGG